ncbi:MAG TPA: carboxyl transferase domain-containing protein, partial [Myxococcota bacterium]|nr:carboxyl transferase domain-containing protein [Myxococcota bacterium]
MSSEDWSAEVEGIRARRRLAQQHGGSDAVVAQHAQGRLVIRERIAGLLDVRSFREQGAIAGASDLAPDGSLRAFTPANYVLGTGRIDGRPCVVGGEDFTQRGGSPSPAGLRKSVFAEDLCVRLCVPLVRLLQGAGGSVTASDGKSPKRSGGEGTGFAPHRFASIAEAMASVPVASAALGAVAGLPAARLVASHFAVMARDERDAFAQIRRVLSYLPTNVWQPAPRAACDDPRDRAEPALLDII